MNDKIKEKTNLLELKDLSFIELGAKLQDIFGITEQDVTSLASQMSKFSAYPKSTVIAVEEGTWSVIESNPHRKTFAIQRQSSDKRYSGLTYEVEIGSYKKMVQAEPLTMEEFPTLSIREALHQQVMDTTQEKDTEFPTTEIHARPNTSLQGLMKEIK